MMPVFLFIIFFRTNGKQSLLSLASVDDSELERASRDRARRRRKILLDSSKRERRRKKRGCRHGGGREREKREREIERGDTNCFLRPRLPLAPLFWQPLSLYPFSPRQSYPNQHRITILRRQPQVLGRATNHANFAILGNVLEKCIP